MENKINKYLFSEMNKEEKEQLFQELENNPEMKKEFTETLNSLAVAETMPNKNDRKEAELGWDRFHPRIQKKKSTSLFPRIMKYAAILIPAFILLMTGYYLFGPDQTPVYIEHIASSGKRLEVVLPDGSTACLAPASRIVYAENFKGKTRKVELDGEALFEVVKEKNKPFIVETDKYHVQVLGTKFNVRSYSKDTQFETGLVEGLVNVFNENESIILSPNEAVQLVDGHLIKGPLDRNEIYFLENGIYIFEDKSIPEILSRIETWYNVEFNITNKALLNSSLTGKAREEYEVESILQAIQRVYPFNSRKISEQTIEIY